MKLKKCKTEYCAKDKDRKYSVNVTSDGDVSLFVDVRDTNSYRYMFSHDISLSGSTTEVRRVLKTALALIDEIDEDDC